MHLLLVCVDLLSTTGKIVFDGMLLMQRDPTLAIPTLHSFLGILLEIVAIYSSLGNMINLPGRYSAVSVITLDTANSQVSLEMVIFRYERSLILSTWTDLRLNIFENVKRASLMASNFRALLWRFDS